MIIEGKEYKFKKLGMGRFARAQYLSVRISEESQIVFNAIGMKGEGEDERAVSTVSEERFDKAYNDLKHLWLEFVGLVIEGDLTTLSDFDSLPFGASKIIMDDFRQAADGIVPKSAAA